MKILFFIFSHSGGKGGHYHSLKFISDAIATREQTEIGIISFGKEAPSILKDSPNFLKNIELYNKRIIRSYFQINKSIRKFKPDILHFFDAHSFNFFYPLSAFHKSKIVLTKCGGANPLRYPIVSNISLFTKENENWFINNPRYKNTNLITIPNRAKKIEVRKYPRLEKSKDKFCFLRICRIDTYFDSIINGINLTKQLSNKGLQVKFIVIGIVQDKKLIDKIKILSKGYDIEVYTNDLYTDNASKMLYLADAVIGTGRGVMEASSLGIPILIPSKQIGMPILLREENFEEMLKYNFTNRARFKNIDNNIELELIEKLVKERGFYENQVRFSNTIYSHFFDVQKGTIMYIDYYRKLHPKKHSLNIISNNTISFLTTLKRILLNQFS